MTANQIVALLVPLIIFGIVVWILLDRRRAQKRTPPQEHAPHRPNAGNDPVASARSKMAGNGAITH